MRLNCPYCNAELDVDAGALSGRSRSIRCASCQRTFRPLTPAAEPLSRDSSWEVELEDGTALLCGSLDDLSEWVSRKVVRRSDPIRYGSGSWETVDDVLNQGSQQDRKEEAFSDAGAIPGPLAEKENQNEGYSIPDREVSSSREGVGSSTESALVENNSLLRSPLFIVLVALCSGIVGWWAGHVGLFLPDSVVPVEQWNSELVLPQRTPLTVESGAVAESLNGDETTDIQSSGKTPEEQRNQEKAEPPPAQPVNQPPTITGESPEKSDVLENKEEAASTEVDEATPKEVTPLPPKSPKVVSAKPSPEGKEKQRDQPIDGEAKTYDDLMRQGNAALNSRRYEAALEFFEKARDQTSSVEPLVKIGRAWLKLNQPQKAAAALRQALKKRPKYMPTYMLLGRALTEINDRQGALGIYRDYIHKFPDGKDLKKAQKAVQDLR